MARSELDIAWIGVVTMPNDPTVYHVLLDEEVSPPRVLAVITGARAVVAWQADHVTGNSILGARSREEAVAVAIAGVTSKEEMAEAIRRAESEGRLK